METPGLDVLIDEYLLGTILPEDKARLERWMASDPQVAEQVHDSLITYKAIQLERNRLLKEKLKALDKEDESKPRDGGKKAGLVISVVGLILLFFLFLTMYESPACIANRHFIDYSVADDGRATFLLEKESWEHAKAAFLQHDYEKAIRDYIVLAGEADTPGHYEARWNILMAQLAAAGPNPTWHHALDAYSLEAPEPLATKAKTLKRKFRSSYYKLFFNPVREKFSSIKPRLI